jgi:hypothetical protein
VQFHQLKPAAGSKAEEKWQFLHQRHHAARLNTEETGWLLGCTEEEVSILMSAKLLIPLGSPAANGRKLLAACEIEKLSQEREWLSKATEAIARHWKKRNGR